MQKVIVQIDWYTKIVLTLIAILLAGLLAKPYVVSRPAGAYGEQEVYVTNWPGRVDVWVENSVKIKDIEATYIGKVDAYVSNIPHVITVVDWKDEEDYQEYLEKQREKEKGE